MKKYLLSLFVCVSALLLGSCNVHKTEIIKDGLDLYTDYITAKGGDWETVGTSGVPGCYVYQDFRFNEIDQSVMSNGLVHVYYCTREKRGPHNEVDCDYALPYPFMVDNEARQKITQTFKFVVERGYLRLIIEWSDAKIYLQGDQSFKVCIIRPN